MTLHDFGKLLRTRWLTVLITTLMTTLAAVGYTLLTTAVYEASTRLFVSTSAGASANELYQGNRLSQDRVLSYVELLEGRTVAQRTIDKLNLDMSADSLTEQVIASAKTNTVLIDVKVKDKSPVRARDIANGLSDEFVTMVRELETPRTGAQPDARVIVEQRASIPTAPISPKPLRNIAAGLAFGLMLGIGLAFVRNELDRTIKDRAELEEVTHVGVVGNIPLSKERTTTPAINFESDNSEIAEAFRKLRTNLQFVAVDDPPRLIVVTSSTPSEGKSTTVINLGLALAEAGHRVLLVDGDMRRPSLHAYLDLLGTVGFSSVLSGSVVLSEAIQETKFPNLSVLAAGLTPPNPSELLGSAAARNALSELRESFDYVIVDSAPLLAVTDGAVLAARADGTILISRHGQTKRDQLAHAVGILEDVGAHVLGAVSSMEPLAAGGAYYGYKYYNYSSDAEASAQMADSPLSEDRDDKLLREVDAAARNETQPPLKNTTAGEDKTRRTIPDRP